MSSNKLTIKQVLLLGLSEPRYSRVEFWQQQQKESGFSPVVFWQKLNDLWQYYFEQNYNDIQEKNSWGNSITDSRIPLLMETNGLMTGHLGKPELEELNFSLFHYGFDLKQNLFPYEYDMDNMITGKDSSPSRQLSVIHLLNQQKFINELKEKQADKISNFLDFHFRAYKRKVARENDNDLLLEEWIALTEKIMPKSFSPQQKDAFFLWIEQHDVNMPLPNADATLKRKFNELSEIFIDEETFKECISALKNVKDPIISEDNRYLLGPKQKSAFTAWYEIVKQREKFKVGVLVTDIVYCLNKEFEGLELGADGSTLRRNNTTMAKKYKVPLSKLIK